VAHRRGVQTTGRGGGPPRQPLCWISGGEQKQRATADAEPCECPAKLLENLGTVRAVCFKFHECREESGETQEGCVTADGNVGREVGDDSADHRREERCVIIAVICLIINGSLRGRAIVFVRVPTLRTHS
jgi:hypothetical protein